MAFFKNNRCPLSDPAYPHTLTIRVSPENDCITCGGKTSSEETGLSLYRCTTCNVEFHSKCLSKKLIHPFHPQHPVTLTTNESKTREQCTWCGSNISGRYYRCSLCNFCLDTSCSKIFPPLTITNPKSHHHSLSFFPRPLLLPCDACGLVDRAVPGFACIQCNYMVHQSCTDLPRVIKITRHQHRLSHTPYLPLFALSTCRVCHKSVDIKYGQYSCDRQGCSYVAHSKCATHSHVWDGRELEWEPEEPYEDIAPFKKLGVDLIQHFCHHDHPLRLEKYVRNVDKQCQACIVRIDSRDFFYDCTQCDFSLHKVCANLPKKLDHALHNHPLVLDPSPLSNYTTMSCSACLQKFSGFRYKCAKENCRGLSVTIQFQIDVRCAILPDCFTHKSHGHPLFIPIPFVNGETKRQGKKMIICKGCHIPCGLCHLECTKCEFVLCYRCATLPDEVYYKYDKHLLSLCHGESVNVGKYWCEVCEKQVDATKWFYTCDQCCITIHLKCIFGSSIYMKPGFTFDYKSYKVNVLRNYSRSRPTCDECNQRCPGYVYYKVYYKKREAAICSRECLQRRISNYSRSDALEFEEEMKVSKQNFKAKNSLLSM